MHDPELLMRVVIVKTHRKHGNGAVGGGRKGKTGKRGIIFQLDANNNRTELVRLDRPTFRALSKDLFATGLIPHHVSIASSGETHF